VKRVAAWKLLVDNHFFPTRDVAERWIMAGKVISGDSRIDKPGQLIPVAAQIRLKDHDRRFVSRGGLKLDHALTVFALPLEGRIALDCGASTGGFTDCLLQRGAARVYAVDAGYGQLSGKLRADPRVANMERTNLGDPRLLNLEPSPDIVTLDLSYLSLRDALPLAVRILAGVGDIVALVKPLFEVEDSHVRRTGAVHQRSTYTFVLRQLVDYCGSQGYPVMGVTHSPIRGGAGTEEYFVFIRLPGNSEQRPKDSHALVQEIDVAVDFWNRATGESAAAPQQE
jgi:23S rRNA (cytidine1920-2'-O)/16S rRNA (cytidine1409-2'-O)-methyltransferase